MKRGNVPGFDDVVVFILEVFGVILLAVAVFALIMGCVTMVREVIS